MPKMVRDADDVIAEVRDAVRDQPAEVGIWLTVRDLNMLLARLT